MPPERHLGRAAQAVHVQERQYALADLLRENALVGHAFACYAVTAANPHSVLVGRLELLPRLVIRRLVLSHVAVPVPRRQVALVAHQKADDAVVALARRVEQRRLELASSRVDVGASVQEALGQTSVTAIARKVERRLECVVPRIDAPAKVQQ